MSDIPEKPPASKGSTSKVGYGKPPEKSKFKKGQSGNPRGRPKRASHKIYNPDELVRMFIQVGNQLVRVERSGEPLNMSQIRAVFEKLYLKAMKGDMQAIRFIINLTIEQYDKEDLRRAAAVDRLATLEKMRSEAFSKIREDRKNLDADKMLLLDDFIEEAKWRIDIDLD